jgi:adenylate kinase family enzyme
MLTTSQYITESYIEKNDYFYKFDKWKNKQINILLLIGSSGSGKTTLGKDISKDTNADLYQTDAIWMPIAKQYKKETGKKGWEWSDEELLEVDRRVIKEIRNIIKKNNKYIIIEGIHLLNLTNKEFKPHCVIIKNTPYWKTLYRALKRDYMKFLKKGIGRFIDHYLYIIKFNKNVIKQIENIKRYLEKQ